MRDLLVFVVVLLGLPASFRRPFLGLLLFSWLAYMRPQDLCWGFARSMRFSFFAGIVMVAGWWAHERGRVPFARWDVRTRLLVVLAVLVSLSYLLAQHQTAYYTRYWLEFLKIMVVALFTTGQVNSRQRFRYMAWTIAICLGFFGVKGGVFGLLTGGARILRGPGGMMEDNNDFALALVMNIPLLWYLGRSETRLPLAVLGTRVAVVLTAITVLLTHSRGAFLAMVSTLLWIAWRSGQLIRAGFGMLLAALAFLAFAPASVLERLGTIGEGTAESSAGARIAAWRTAFRMIGDNPVFGVGMRNFQPRYKDYAWVPPDGTVRTYVAHNSYLQIWAESGSLAFGCYLALLLSVFAACRRVVQMGRLRPDLAWLRDYGRMLEATTVGFMVGAVFLNRGHFDLIYHWLALVSALVGIAWAAWRRPVHAAAAATGGVAVQWRGALPRLRRWERARS